MKPKHPGGRPPAKHPPLIAVAFKCGSDVEDALEFIRQHLDKDAVIGATKVTKSSAFRYAILTTKKTIEDMIAKETR